MASVNVPTNQKIKEQDVNAKLQLYGIYAGMSRPLRVSRPANGAAPMNLKLTRDFSFCQWQGSFG